MAVQGSDCTMVKHDERKRTHTCSSADNTPIDDTMFHRCCVIIQSAWREYRRSLNAKASQHNDKKQQSGITHDPPLQVDEPAQKSPAVIVYSTSIGAFRKVIADTDRIKLILDIKNVSYQVVDFALDREKRRDVNMELDALPQVLAFGEYIGGVDNVQRLEDEGLLDVVLTGGHRLRCLHCHVARSLHMQRCSACWFPYNFYFRDNENDISYVLEEDEGNEDLEIDTEAEADGIVSPVSSPGHRKSIPIGRNVYHKYLLEEDRRMSTELIKSVSL